jgi:hypothetical protein
MQESMRIVALKICSVFLIKIWVDLDKKHVIKRSTSTGRAGRPKVIVPRHSFNFNGLVTCHFNPNKIPVTCHTYRKFGKKM